MESGKGNESGASRNSPDLHGVEGIGKSGVYHCGCKLGLADFDGHRKGSVQVPCNCRSVPIALHRASRLYVPRIAVVIDLVRTRFYGWFAQLF